MFPEPGFVFPSGKLVIFNLLGKCDKHYTDTLLQDTLLL